MTQESKRWVKESYRRWVSDLPCAVTGSPGPNPAHHVKTKTNSGMGKKPSDTWCISLRYDLHSELHQKGAVTFEEKHNVSLVMLALKTCQKWIEER